MTRHWRLIVAALAMVIGISGAAWGQGWSHHDRQDNGYWNNDAYSYAQDRDRDDRDRDDHDRDHHRDRDHDRDRDHHRGRDRDRDHDRDRDRDHRGGYYENGGYYGNGRYGNGGYGYYPGGRGGSYNQAGRVGYQDGIADGQHDRSTGHSFRPTQDDNYRNADRGYSSNYGDKNGYKQQYRQAYEQGYQQGYGGRR